MKIFVEVKTPGNGKTYEFQLDSNLTVRQAKSMMIDEITEIENGNITLNPESSILSSLNTQSRLEDARTLTAAGVKSGHCLLLL